MDHSARDQLAERDGLLQRDPELLRDPPDLLVRLPIQPGDVPETYADISAIQRDLGFAPSTPIDVGVPRFVDWYRGYSSRG